MARFFFYCVFELRSTTYVTNAVTAVLCARADHEEDEVHLIVDDVPVGLRDVVMSWVTSLRWSVRFGPVYECCKCLL